MNYFVILSLAAAGLAAGGILGYILRRTQEPRLTLLLLAAAIPIGGGLGYVLLGDRGPGSWIIFLAVCWIVGQGIYQTYQWMCQKKDKREEAQRPERISGPMKLAAVIIISCLFNCGFFPIVNFNPDNPVDLGTIMLWLTGYMAVMVHKEIGTWEARIFPKRSVLFASIFNVALILAGLLCRYLLELGEASNACNFTAANILFHVAVFALLSTVIYALERRKG